jgi:ABC-type methionine transport system ATPase subunit
LKKERDVNYFFVVIIQEKLENELHIFYKCFVILYADDTVILSETKEGMQQALDILESYCEIWRLQVNVAKTKVMIFRKRKTAQDPKFILHGQTLDIVDTKNLLNHLKILKKERNITFLLVVHRYDRENNSD